jgi:hypothetical protein
LRKLVRPGGTFETGDKEFKCPYGTPRFVAISLPAMNRWAVTKCP